MMQRSNSESTKKTKRRMTIKYMLLDANDEQAMYFECIILLDTLEFYVECVLLLKNS